MDNHRSFPLIRAALEVFCSVLVAAELVGLAAGAAAQKTDPERIVQILSNYEHLPSRAYFSKLGPETVEVLEALYHDRARPDFIRLRAVRVASFFTTPRARTFLLEVARKPDEKDLFVRQAVLGLVEAFGNRVADELVAFLDHEKPLVRKTAAQALAAIATNASRRALQRRLKKETNAVVRTAIRQALEQTGIKDRSAPRPAPAAFDPENGRPSR